MKSSNFMMPIVIKSSNFLIMPIFIKKKYNAKFFKNFQSYDVNFNTEIKKKSIFRWRSQQFENPFRESMFPNMCSPRPIKCQKLSKNLENPMNTL